jgi:8-oxo-dGTP diphosphatase
VTASAAISYIHWLRQRIGHQKALIVYGSVILLDERRRVLLQRRTDNGLWGLPGGILEPGENIIECTRRELDEETGLQAGELRLTGLYSDPRYDVVYPNGDQVQQYTVCFEGQLSGGQMRLDPRETCDLAFFDRAEIPRDQIAVFYLDMLRDAEIHGPPAFSPPYAAPVLLDVIDQLRPLIGKELFIGAGAMAAVRRQDGRLLVVRRTDDGEWSLPGGFTHLGENAAHTAVREVFEETGVRIRPERLLGISSQVQPWVYPNGDQTQAVVSLFLAHPLGGELRPDGVESSQVAWMTPQELLALKTHPNLDKLNRAVVESLEGSAFVLS